MQMKESIVHESAPSVQPPSDPEILKAVETLALYVARNGVAFEVVAMEKHVNDPRFGFLFGGTGKEYYKWKILENKVRLYDIRQFWRQVANLYLMRFLSFLFLLSWKIA